MTSSSLEAQVVTILVSVRVGVRALPVAYSSSRLRLCCDPRFYVFGVFERACWGDNNSSARGYVAVL